MLDAKSAPTDPNSHRVRLRNAALRSFHRQRRKVRSAHQAGVGAGDPPNENSSSRVFVSGRGGVGRGRRGAAGSAIDYPARPVRVIDGFGGGSTPDLVSRLIGQWLSERLHQPFVVDNRVGAGGNIAAEAVAHSAPDGYTLLTCVTADAINATLYAKLDFDFPGDFAPIAGVIQLPMVLLVNPAFPAKTLSDSSLMPKPIPARSILLRPASARQCMSRSSCSRCRPISTSCTCLIAARRRLLPISWPDRFKPSSSRCRRRSVSSGTADCAAWR